MATAGLPSGTVTFLFTDIEGSTRLLGTLGQHRYDELLTEHSELLRAAFAAHDGRVVDTQGDSFFVAFRTAADAVAAAVDAQRDLAAWRDDVKVRMGLHTGEPKVGEDRYVGIGVHRAARIGAAGHGGQVLLSWTTKGLAEEDLPPGVTIQDLGERRLKDIDQPQHLYQLDIEGLPSRFGALKTLDVELARKRRRLYAGAALVGVLAAAVAIPVFALGQGDSSGGVTVQGNGVAEIDPSSNRVASTVQNGGSSPGAVTYAAGSLWVANPQDQTVVRIDPATGSVTKVLPLPGTPSTLAATPGSVWVVTSIPSAPPISVQRIDPQFDTVAAPAIVENAVVGGRPVAASRGADLWVAGLAGPVTRLRGGRIVDSVDPKAVVGGVAVSPGSVWVTSPGSDRVTRVDSATGLASTPTTVGNGPSDIAFGAGAIWVANTLAGTVTRIDPSNAGATNTITVGASPVAIAADAEGVWVANSRDGTVTRIDPTPSELTTTTIPVGGSPQAVAIGGGRVWVSVRALAPDFVGAPAAGSARLVAQDDVDSPDPALAYSPASWQLEYATCAKLLNYPDRPVPAGTQLVPEVAQALPTVSDGGKTYTFTIRKGFRFSPPSNAPVTAATFKYTIERTLDPRMKSFASGFPMNIVGADAYAHGRARHIAGVTANGNSLTVRLTKPTPEFPILISLPFFCAVPVGTPVDPNGVRGVPSAGPYYVASFVPQQGVVLKRNPNYRGSRPHRLTRITLVVGVPKNVAVGDIEAGRADYALDGVAPEFAAGLADRYGPGRGGRQQYFVNAQPWLDYLVLNTQRPLFRDVRLRRAVNFALDRSSLSRAGSIGNPFPSQPTESYLPPAVPGATGAHPYPLKPDVATAKKLAGSRHRTAVLYTCTYSPCDQWAQIITDNLAKIGIDVEVKTFIPPDLFDRLGKPGEPFDILTAGWVADYLDPSQFLNALLSGGLTPRFTDAAAQRKLAEVARLTGPARYRAYGKLDAELVRDYAPLAAFGNGASRDFFSARIGCQVFNPIYGMDLAALCVRS